MPHTSAAGAVATLSDYEAFLTSQAGDGRWELIAGAIVAMTDPDLNHGLIVGNIFVDVYRGLPTMKHIAFVYQGQMRIEHFRRAAEGWIPTVLTRPADLLDSDALGVSLDLDAVYLDVPVLRPIEAAGADEDEPPVPIP